MIHFFKIFLRIYNRLFSKDKVFVKRLRNLLGFTPANLGIFKLAFYHKSTTSDRLYAVQSNERLEYLGDAVLATIVAEYLFKKYPNSNEGFLTKMRSKIVKRQSLNTIADKMGLDVFLNQYNNTRLSKSMLGNALEALVGAVYLEKGYHPTKRFVVSKILLGYLDIHELESYDDNYKSQLLEWCQKNGKVVSYKMVSKYKFDKRDRFKVAVLIDEKKLADADDFNKKSAEQTASEKAMKILGILTDDNDTKSKKEKRETSLRSSNSRSKSDRNSRLNSRDNDKRDRKNKSEQDKREKKPKAKAGKKESDRNRPEKKNRQERPTANIRKKQTKSEGDKPRDRRSQSSQSNRTAKTDQRTEQKAERQPRKPRPSAERKTAVNKQPQVKRNSAKPVEEDWEDINVDDIKPITPVTPPKAAKKGDNAKTGKSDKPRKYYRRKPQKKSNSGNENNSTAKKELTD